MQKWKILVSGATASVVAGFVLLAAMPSYAQQSAPAVTKDLVLKEDAQCTRCHDEEDSPGVLTIGRTKHGTQADARTPTCTSCHGESRAHMNAPIGSSNRPKSDRTFGKGSHTPADMRSDTCLTCHQGAQRMFWSVSTHAARDVSCDSCHKVHNEGTDKVRERKTQSAVCFDCHKTQRVQINKPSRHPITEGKVICSDCHNAHGSAGPAMMARDTVNDTCFKCHVEKRGPFLWNHQPVTENCALCHEPHGTTVASLLRWRSPFLCQQCHEPSSHRGNIPGLWAGANDEAGKNITLARACQNCHTNIHGGNNPISSSGSRSFRQ